MIGAALEAVFVEERGATLALAAFDDHGNLVAAHGPGADPSTFEPIVAAWRAAVARGHHTDELRLEGRDAQFVGRVIGEALVVARVREGEPTGRTAVRLRLHHDAIRGALP